jgi:hypothetical protein
LTGVREFRPSLRGTIVMATFLAFATWLLLRVALRFDPRPATIATVCALASLLALRLAFDRPRHALRLVDDGLSVRFGSDAREVPWTAIRRVGLAYGEIETRRGVARVQYARIEVSAGPPIAFADLSALDGAEVVLEDSPTPVIDVADPEVLLGIIAERINAREFLPSARGASPTSRNWLGGLGAAVTLFRGVFFAVLAVTVAERLWDAPTSTLAAVTAGIAAALAVAAAAQFAAGRIALPGPTHTPAVASLFPTLLASLVAWRFFGTSEHAQSAAWMLAAALALALPVAPFPGAAIARSIGIHAARPRGDAAAAILIAVAGAAAAVLLGKGMRLIPIAILAAGAEAAEGYLAGLRAARLAAAPRFAEWPLDTVAELRSMLRASYDDDLADRAAAIDRSLLERTEFLRRNRPAPLSIVVAALVSIALTAAVAHHTTRLSSTGREAIGILVR